MRFRQTKLEQELAALDAASRARELQRRWQEFKQSQHFDLLRYVLREVEAAALDALRARPLVTGERAAVELAVVDKIRHLFQSFDHDFRADWYDEEDSWSEDTQ